MVPDDEGFLYPQIDENRCVNCKKCEAACPIISKYEKESFHDVVGIIARTKNADDRAMSTSGGFFSVLAKYVLRKKGKVFGAAFTDEQFKVGHIGIDSVEDLNKLSRSKYVQSDVGYSYTTAKEYLDSGVDVLFSGTPCQIEALYHFLGKKYDNLLTCDTVCRSVPSPLLWKEYVNYINGSQGKVAYVGFREKSYGYSYSTLTFKDDKGKTLYSEGIDVDQYLRAFFSDTSVRPSCYDCKFKNVNKRSDFTIWDCFDPSKFDKSFDDDLGCTRVLINSKKGLDVFKECCDYAYYKEIDINTLTKDSKELFESVRWNSHRNDFFDDFNKYGVEYALNKYFPISLRNITERFVRRFCNKTKVYRYALRVYKSLFSRSGNRYRMKGM